MIRYNMDEYEMRKAYKKYKRKYREARFAQYAGADEGADPAQSLFNAFKDQCQRQPHGLVIDESEDQRRLIDTYIRDNYTKLLIANPPEGRWDVKITLKTPLDVNENIKYLLVSFVSSKLIIEGGFRKVEINGD